MIITSGSFAFLILTAMVSLAKLGLLTPASLNPTVRVSIILLQFDGLKEKSYIWKEVFLTPNGMMPAYHTLGRLDFLGFVPKPMVQGCFIKKKMEKFLKELNEKVKLTDKNRTREDKCHPMDSTPLIS